MATFGPTAQMVANVDEAFSDDKIVNEIEWLDQQLNHPSAYEDPHDNWLISLSTG